MYGWSIPWPQLPWPILPRHDTSHDLLEHVLLNLSDQNVVLYYMLIWGLELLNWWCAQDSCMMSWIIQIELQWRLTWFSSFANCISFQLQASTAQPIPASWRNCLMRYHTLCDQSVSINELTQCHLLRRPAYLVFDANPLEDFEEGLTQLHAIMCIVKMREAEKSTFSFPLRRC